MAESFQIPDFSVDDLTKLARKARRTHQGRNRLWEYLQDMTFPTHDEAGNKLSDEQLLEMYQKLGYTGQELPKFSEPTDIR